MSQRSSRSWKAAGVVLVAGVALAAAWQLFANLFVARLIDSAYHEKSFAVLNGLFEGRSVHPVTHYLDVWHRFASQLTIGLAALTTLGAAMLSPIVQRFIDRMAPMTPASPGEGFRALTGRRRLAVLAVVLLLPGIQVMETVLRAEHWPFSFYSMYSSEQTSTMVWYRVYGVTQSGDEIFLNPGEYLRPFDVARIPYGFEDVVLQRPNKDLSTKNALANCLELYENSRLKGWHNGPALKGVRLYRLQWHIEPSASNKNSPDKRELINAYPSGL